VRRLKRQRRIHLRFPKNKNGAGEGARTRDIQPGKLTLYTVQVLSIKCLRRLKNYLGVMLGGVKGTDRERSRGDGIDLAFASLTEYKDQPVPASSHHLYHGYPGISLRIGYLNKQ